MVMCNSDNTQVVVGLNTGKSDNPVAMSLLRRIFWLCVINNCYIVASHIPGRLNVEADSLSRIKDNDFKIPFGFCCCRCCPIATEAGQSGSSG